MLAVWFSGSPVVLGCVFGDGLKTPDFPGIGCGGDGCWVGKSEVNEGGVRVREKRRLCGWYGRSETVGRVSVVILLSMVMRVLMIMPLLRLSRVVVRLMFPCVPVRVRIVICLRVGFLRMIILLMIGMIWI